MNGRTWLPAVAHAVAYPLLAWATAEAVRHGSPQLAALCLAAAVAALIGVYHGVIRAAAAHRTKTRRPASRLDVPGGVADPVRAELAAVCDCERWWTSLGTAHDPQCPNLTPGSAA